jgi:valyl-tRNA synthetase
MWSQGTSGKSNIMHVLQKYLILIHGQGVDRFDARKSVVTQLQNLQVYRGKDTNHPMRLAICSRSGDVIEPLIQPQWYISTTGLASKVLEHTAAGDITVSPVHHKNELNRWLNNIQDWCISRQLWWGHRIPAFQVQVSTAEEATGMYDG